MGWMICRYFLYNFVGEWGEDYHGVGGVYIFIVSVSMRLYIQY
jgi:hypothetical protein